MTGSGTIISTGTYALYGSKAATWSVQNMGMLAAAKYGVELTKGVLLTNGAANCASAVITGGTAGVQSGKGISTVVNYATITSTGANGYGVGLQLGGSVANGAATHTALISGAKYGVLVGGGTGTISNGGTIAATGNNGIGVAMAAGGNFTNGVGNSAALVSGISDGVSIRGVSSIVNAGSIIASAGVGVYRAGTGNIVNGSAKALAASIYGTVNGVQAKASPMLGLNSVINWGSVGGHIAGVEIDASGNLINGNPTDTNARITGGLYGASINGRSTITNYGTITGTGPVVPNLHFPPTIFPVPPHSPWGSYGIDLMEGGLLVNGSNTSTAADIYAKFIGAQLKGGLVTVNNYATISGGVVGVYTWLGGTLVNGSLTDGQALISGGQMGIWNTYPNDTIQNYASISSWAGSAVDLAAGGHPGAAGILVNGSTLDTTATISGYLNGVTTVNGATVENYATIVGTQLIGAYVTAGGLLTNGNAQDTAAYISGNTIGAAVKGGFLGGGTTPLIVNTLSNDGVIQGQTIGAALLGSAAGVLINGATNVTGATIEGHAGAGLASTGGASNVVYNYGTIRSVSGYGVSFTGATQLINGTTGTTHALITGTEGVENSGSRASIQNYGTITGSAGAGIYLNAAGSVQNGAGGTHRASISGGTYGVFMDGAQGNVGTVTNYASITAWGGAGIGAYLGTGGLLQNGTASDHDFATIQGGATAVKVIQGGTVQNFGSLIGGSGAGVMLTAGGTVLNGSAADSSASISGAASGVWIRGGTGSLANDGAVASGTSGIGAYLGSGGAVVNGTAALTQASITGGSYGAEVLGGAASIVNNGSVTGVGTGVKAGFGGYVENYGDVAGTNGAGISVSGAAGTIVNGSAADQDASVSGATAGIWMRGGAGSLANFGSIYAGAAGVGAYLGVGGQVTNGLPSDTGAMISGGTYGVQVAGGPSSIANDGTIVATAGAGIGTRQGGSISNGAAGNGGATYGALISGTTYGIAAQGSNLSTVVNFGAVSASLSASVGVLMSSGGSLVNGSASDTTASIAAGGTGARIGAGGAATNWGLVTGTAGTGVSLTGGGSVTNGGRGDTTASIMGASGGVSARGGLATVTNSGQIGSGNAGIGVYLGNGGRVANGSVSIQSASISGGAYGVQVMGAALSLTNDGIISAAAGAGVYSKQGGTFTNGAYGATGAVISGSTYGINAQGTTGAAIANYGTVLARSGAGLGVFMMQGGTLANGSSLDTTALIKGGAVGVRENGSPSALRVVQNYGTITGGIGVDFGAGSAPGTVVNAGTISGTNGTAVQFGNGNDKLLVEAGAVFIGQVSGGGGTSDVAEFATGFNNTVNLVSFETATIDAQSVWTMTNASSLQTLNDGGLLRVGNGGSLDVTSSITGKPGGAIALWNSSTLEVGGSMAASGPAIEFLGSSGSTLAIDAAGSFGSQVGSKSYSGPQLQDFTSAAAIDFKKILLKNSTLSFDQNTGLLQIANGGTAVATLQFDTSTLGAGTFHMSDDGTKHLLLTHS